MELQSAYLELLLGCPSALCRVRLTSSWHHAQREHYHDRSELCCHMLPLGVWADVWIAQTAEVVACFKGVVEKVTQLPKDLAGTFQQIHPAQRPFWDASPPKGWRSWSGCLSLSQKFPLRPKDRHGINA